MAMDNEELIKELLKGVDFKKLTPEQVTGRDGLIQQLTKRIVETAMQAEMTDHLGYEKNEKPAAKRSNSRNGKSSKTVITNNGAIEIAIQRLAGGVDQQRAHALATAGHAVAHGLVEARQFLARGAEEAFQRSVDPFLTALLIGRDHAG